VLQVVISLDDNCVVAAIQTHDVLDTVIARIEYCEYTLSGGDLTL
jgi:hypothetical protein